MAKIITLTCNNANCYIIKTESSIVMIDSGHPGDADMIEKKLADAGITPAEIKLLILTHGHMDHTGTAEYFKTKYQTPIAMNPIDGTILELDSRGLIGAVIKFLSEKELHVELKIQSDIHLLHGQRMDQYGLPAQIIALPGHTRGSIGILFDDGNLFAGDMFMNFLKPSLAHIYENEEDLKKSWELLKTYPITTVYPGHGKSFPFRKMR